MIKKHPQAQPSWNDSFSYLKRLVAGEAVRSGAQLPSWRAFGNFQTEQLRTQPASTEALLQNHSNELAASVDRQVARPYKLPASPSTKQLSKENSMGQSPRQLQLRINLQTAFNCHNLKYKYTAVTTIAELIKYLKDIAGFKYLLFRSGNCMLDYVLTLEKQRVAVLSVVQPLNLRIEQLSQLPGLPDNSLKRFNVIRCIGSGGFSKVFLAEVNGVYVALKVIDKEFLIQNDKEIIVENEKKILTELDHPFITKVHYTIQTEKKIAIALEYCSGGELFYLLKRVKRMRESEARFYFLEVLSAIKALHDRSMVYRDLKPENIILDYEGHVRLADFGLSKVMEDDFTHSFCGSAEYMAPEMLQRGGHNYSVDYYCIGALLYQLVTGLPPYYSKDQNQLFHNILNNELQFPERFILSCEIKSLLSQLLTKDPTMRLGNIQGVSQIWQHPWLLGISEEDVLAKKLTPPFHPNVFEENFDNAEFKAVQAEALSELEKEKIYGDLRKPHLKNFFFESEEMKTRRHNISSQGKQRTASPFTEHNVDAPRPSQEKAKLREDPHIISRPFSPNPARIGISNQSPRRQLPSAADLPRDNSFKRALPDLIRYKSHGNLLTSYKSQNQNLSTRYPSKERKDDRYNSRREHSANKQRKETQLLYNRSQEFRRSLQDREYTRYTGVIGREVQQLHTPYQTRANLSLKRPQSHRNLDLSTRNRHHSPAAPIKPSYTRLDPPKRELRKGYCNKQKLRNYFSKRC